MKWLIPKRNRTRFGTGTETSNRSDTTRWNSAKFDESTGQVYLETTAALPASDDRHWARDSQLVNGADYRDEQQCEDYVKSLGGGRMDVEEYQKRLDGLKNSKIRGCKGARSLQDAAIECVLQNISDITLEGIECLPVPILRRIWRAVNKRCSECVTTWSIFSRILRHDALTLDLLRYHQNIQAPNCRLDVYTDPLTSKSYDFITSLSITVPVPISDLVKLSNVTNLGVLEIINTQGCENIAVGDRLLRSWHTEALNEGAFSVLRILKLWNHESLTIKSLAYLNGFPALALYDVHGCSFDLDAKVEATRLGWRPTLDTNILGLLEKACVERASLMRTHLGIESRHPLEFPSEHLYHGARVRRIPREHMPAFIAQAEATSEETVDASQTKPSVKDSEKTGAQSRNRRMKYAAESCCKREAEAWDITNYRKFARIGELRNDTDLLRAGVVVGDQAVVGNEFINSVPMVSLRLGESPPWLESSPSSKSGNKKRGEGSNYEIPTPSQSHYWKGKPSLATSTLLGLAFIRIKAAPQDPVMKNESPNSLGSMQHKLTGTGPHLKQPTSSKRQEPGILRNKRRKLDDILSSFL